MLLKGGDFMDATEATSNIVIAMINSKFISTPEEISSAYKEIYKAVRYPENVNV
jgi:hypothetical protein